MSKLNKNHKVISLKKITDHKNSESQKFLQEEQKFTLQREIEKGNQQLASLKKQREKMLQDLKEAIEKEKQDWVEQKELEQQEAKEMGYKIGFDEGREKALTKYESLIKEANKIVEMAKEDYYQTIAKHEEAIISLAISTAKKIIGQEIEEDHEKMTSMIEKAIEELKDHSNITIYVHPDDYPTVVNQKGELEQLLEEGEMIYIYPDQRLNTGDCKIKHPFGQIDAGIDTQLSQIKSALEEKLSENL